MGYLVFEYWPSVKAIGSLFCEFSWLSDWYDEWPLTARWYK